MSVEDLDMECPNCGRSLSADATVCPFCLIELKMADLEELERVSREDYVPEAPQYQVRGVPCQGPWGGGGRGR